MLHPRTSAEITVLRSKRARLIALSILLTGLTGYLGFLIYSTPTSYRATARICMPGEKTVSDFWTNTGIVSTTTVATETINSETFVKTALEKGPIAPESFIAADYCKRGTYSNFPFDVAVISSSETHAMQASFIITDAGDSTFLIKTTGSLNAKSALGTFNQDLAINGFTIHVKRKNASFQLPAYQIVPSEYILTIANTNSIAENLLNGSGDLEVSQVNDVVKVSATSTNPVTASQLVNALAYHFISNTKKKQKRLRIQPTTPLL